MPKALLIRPASTQIVEKRTKKFNRRFPPLSLLYIASMLRNEGWEVEVADINANPKLSQDQVVNEASQAQLIVLTTNPYADWQCPSYDIDPIIKFAECLPSERLIITGNHGTHFPSAILKLTKAKVVVRGEPEKIVLSTARAVLENSSLKDIDGISYQEEGTVIHNKMPIPSSDFNFPKPAYDLVNLNDYYYELLGHNFALLETTRGCPYSCSFCNLSMFEKRYRKRPLQHVLDEIDDLVINKKCRSLYIFDLEFAVNERMAKAVSEYMIEKGYAAKYGFRWACQTRADSVSEELLALMKKSGCELIHFGVEAGNEAILSATNKRINKSAIKKGIRATQNAGIKSAAFFMFGFPGENQKTYRETLEFALELNPTYASFHPLLPFPGSPLYSQTFGGGPYWNEPLPLGRSYFNEEQELEIKQFIKFAYRSYYLRPRYIWQQLRHGDIRHYKMQFELFKNFALGQ